MSFHTIISGEWLGKGNASDKKGMRQRDNEKGRGNHKKGEEEEDKPKKGWSPATLLQINQCPFHGKQGSIASF